VHKSCATRPTFGSALVRKCLVLQVPHRYQTKDSGCLTRNVQLRKSRLRQDQNTSRSRGHRIWSRTYGRIPRDGGTQSGTRIEQACKYCTNQKFSFAKCEQFRIYVKLQRLPRESGKSQGQGQVLPAGNLLGWLHNGSPWVQRQRTPSRASKEGRVDFLRIWIGTHQLQRSSSSVPLVLCPASRVEEKTQRGIRQQKGVREEIAGASRRWVSRRTSRIPSSFATNSLQVTKSRLQNLRSCLHPQIQFQVSQIGLPSPIQKEFLQLGLPYPSHHSQKPSNQLSLNKNFPNSENFQSTQLLRKVINSLQPVNRGKCQELRSWRTDSSYWIHRVTLREPFGMVSSVSPTSWPTSSDLLVIVSKRRATTKRRGFLRRNFILLKSRSHASDWFGFRKSGRLKRKLSFFNRRDCLNPSKTQIFPIHQSSFFLDLTLTSKESSGRTHTHPLSSSMIGIPWLSWLPAKHTTVSIIRWIASPLRIN